MLELLKRLKENIKEEVPFFNSKFLKNLTGQLKLKNSKIETQKWNSSKKNYIKKPKIKQNKTEESNSIFLFKLKDHSLF